MPLHRQLNVLFVHIPKTGGSSIEAALRKFGPLELSAGRPIESPIWRECGHSPQHLTLTELQSRDLIPAGAKCFTVVREPTERVVSVYNYKGHMMPFDTFLAQFLDKSPAAVRRWDAHNLSNMDFIRGSDGQVPEWLRVIPYAQDGLLATVGEYIFGKSPSANSARLARFSEELRILKGPLAHLSVADLSPEQRTRITQFYQDDIEALGHLFQVESPGEARDPLSAFSARACTPHACTSAVCQE